MLQTIWEESKIDQTYYSKYNELKIKHKEDVFSILTDLANDLEKIFDKNFYNGIISLQKLTPKEAHEQKISPFRTKIAEIFSQLDLDKSKESEFKYFKDMISKARFQVKQIENRTIHYTEMKTDNYLKIYEIIAQIEQGATPYEILKVQQLLKKLL